MEVTKIIKFFKLTPEPSISFSEINGRKLNEETYNIFKTAFPEINYYDFIFEKKQLFFEIINYNANELFGTCSSEESISPTSFMRQRNISTKETNPISLSPDEMLETYTYFYINFNKNLMATIMNKKISKINKAISQFIWEKSNNMSSIRILPDKIQNMKEELKRFKLLKELELEFPKKPSLDDIPSLKKTITGECDVERFKINLKLSSAKPSLINKLVDYKNENNDEFTSLKLLAKNEFGLDETVNFFEAIYSKTVPITLNEDTVQNLSYIKNLLSQLLDDHSNKTR